MWCLGSGLRRISTAIPRPKWPSVSPPVLWLPWPGGRSGRSRERPAWTTNTVARILRGETWPDIATVAHLEHGLGADLWPGRGSTQGWDTVGEER